MIKPLTKDEFTVELIEPIFREVESAVPADRRAGGMDLPYIVKKWGELMDLNAAKVWAAYVDGRAVGVMGGMFLPEFYTGQPMAMELFWFVLREHRGSMIGLRLLKEFEKEAISRGSKTLWAGSNRFHEPERMMRVYERLGYEWWGTTFRKIV